MRQKTIKLATFASTILVSTALLCVSGNEAAYPYERALPVERISFDISAATPIDFIAFSRKFNADVGRVNYEDISAAPFEFVSPLQQPAPTFNEASLEPHAAAAAPLPTPAVRRPVIARLPKVGASASKSAALYSLPSHLDTLDKGVDRISFTTPTLAPMAFMRFCMRYAGDCKASRMAFRPKPVALTAARRAELVKINRDVNRAIRPQENLSGVMAEEWLVSPRQGDCNDYAVTKRHELLARGWPSRSLLLAEVVVPSGEHHLVLVVRTKEQDLVLDNLNWNVRPVSQIRYQWVRMQQANNPKFWSMVGITRAARVAMNVR